MRTIKQTFAMKNRIHHPALVRGGISRVMLMIALLVVAISCQKDEEIVVSMGDPVSLSASTDEVVLSQAYYSGTAVIYTWTRGSNKGTGSSISYRFELDIAGNDFSNAEVTGMGKGAYEKSYSVAELNDLLLTKWNIPAGTETVVEARVIADVTMEGVADDTSGVVSLHTAPFDPVSDVLYLVGTSAPNGTDITSAYEMTPDPVQSWIFSYRGPMNQGSFIFSVTRDDCWCNGFYIKDEADTTKMIYVQDGQGQPEWGIPENANYTIRANLIMQTVSIEKLSGPEYSSLYIVGDASPSGWDIAAPDAFVQDAENPYVFTYEGDFTAGEFKISTFTGDWCDGNWINATQPDQVLTATDFIITQACDGPDNKWRVTAETAGRYRITVDLFNNTIHFEEI